MSDFVYALRHYHWQPDQPHLFASYEEQSTSVPTVVDGKRAATIFLKNKNSMLRALKLGWVDETEAVRRSLAPKTEPKAQKRKYTKRK